MKTWIMGILLILVGLILAIGLWLLGYHLSGKWAFNRWKAERVAMGDRLDWKDLVPPPVPTDQNFAEASLVRGAIVEKGQVDPRFQALALSKDAAGALGNWQEGRRDDLEAAARAYGVKDILVGLKPIEATLKELDDASRRPACRLPVDYKEGAIPALLGFRATARTLRIRALGNLAHGYTDRALEDFQTCFRIADHLKNEPQLISALLRVAILNTAMQVLWEGMEDGRWSPAQLLVIQAELTRVDLLATLEVAWQSERQGFIESMSATADNRPGPLAWRDPEMRRVRFGALGRGWFYRNLLEWCRYMSHLVDLQDPVAHRVYPSRAITPEAWERQLRFRIDLVMARIAIPALVGQAERFAMLQALIDEATVVCALERFRLDQGQYPDHLKALAPNYLATLPHDLVTGGPLRYSRQGATFWLYQVGWDGKDDHGVPGRVGEGKERKLDPTKGDWTWPHASH